MMIKKEVYVTFFLLCFSILLNAQFDKGKYIDVSIGYGIAAPYDAVDITGTGFYTQAEYVFALKTWFQLRPYAGLIFASTSDEDEQMGSGEVISNAFMLGGKFRIAAPIPYVAPFLELGIGASAGKFVTRTAFTNIEGKGVYFHIPFSFGLALGKTNNVELEFSYYFHPKLEQFSGAFAAGISIPLSSK